MDFFDIRRSLIARELLMRAVRNAMDPRSYRKRRHGLSAKSHSARSRGSVVTVHRRRLAVPVARDHYDTYWQHDLRTGNRLRGLARLAAV